MERGEWSGAQGGQEGHVYLYCRDQGSSGPPLVENTHLNKNVKTSTKAKTAGTEGKWALLVALY